LDCHVTTIPSYSQKDVTFFDLFISKDALHVSGGSSAHHQEHTTVQTASCIVKPILFLAVTVAEMELRSISSTVTAGNGTG